MTKFKELCTAFSKAQSDFIAFQSDCHQFAVEMMEELKVYFEVPDKQYSLYKINEQNQFVLVQNALVNALTLRPDSSWQFGIGLTVCSAPESLPQELILIHIHIRQDMDGDFYIKYGNQEEEHKVMNEEKFDFIPFFDFLHETIIKTYEDHITHFVGKETRRKIGY